MSERMPHVSTELNPAELTNPTLAFMLDYWKHKRGDRAMPSRADIDPCELKEHLGWVIMVDVLPQARDFRYRLIGTLITEYFFREGTGETVTEAFAKYGQGVTNGVLAVMRAAVREKLPILSCGDSDAFAPGFEAFQSLFLPLSDDGENVNVLLNPFVFNRPEVLMARQIAKANGGRLPQRIKSLPGAA
jgi:hypothetical protein